MGRGLLNPIDVKSAYKKRGPTGGRLVIFSAYTPQNFSVLGVGADPFTTPFPERFSHVFRIHLFVNRQNACPLPER